MKFSVHFRAAEHGNIEALIKLGIAYLYNEGCKYIAVMSVSYIQMTYKKLVNEFSLHLVFSCLQMSVCTVEYMPNKRTRRLIYAECVQIGYSQVEVIWHLRVSSDLIYQDWI